MKYFANYWVEETEDPEKTLRESLTPFEMCVARMLNDMASSLTPLSDDE